MNAGAEKWVPEAIAQQEEHIKRNRSCSGRVGLSHQFRPHGKPSVRESWSACIVCGVTETDNDYQLKMGNQS